MKAALAGSEGHLGLCEDGARGLEGLASSNWRAGAVRGLEGEAGGRGWRDWTGGGLEAGEAGGRAGGRRVGVVIASSSCRRVVPRSACRRPRIVVASSLRPPRIVALSLRRRSSPRRRRVIASSSRQSRHRPHLYRCAHPILLTRE